MTSLILLAARNLSRHRKRTVITAVSLAVGVGFYIFMDAWLLGVDRDSERNLVLYETAAGRVMHDSYWEEKDHLPLDRNVSDPEVVISRLAGLGIPAAPRISFSGEVILRKGPFPEDGSFTARIIAVDPARNESVFPLEGFMTDGEGLRAGGSGALLGAWLAEDIGARVGNPLTVLTRTRGGYLQTIDLDVAGILDTPNPFVNRSGIFIDLLLADILLEMEGEVTEVCVSLPLPAERGLPPGGLSGPYRETARLVENEFPGLEFMDYKELSAEHTSLTRMKNMGSKVMGLLIFVIAAVGITNTMLTAVFERTREIGMMRALGMDDRKIRVLFTAEAAGIGVIGAFFGLVLGSVLTWWIVTWGIDYSFLMREMDAGYRLTGVMKGMWNPPTMLKAALLSILGCAVVAWLPARRAVRMRITECFRK